MTDRVVPIYLIGLILLHNWYNSHCCVVNWSIEKSLEAAQVYMFTGAKYKIPAPKKAPFLSWPTFNI